MRLKKYLKEMTIDAALQVLGLSNDDIGDESKLKKAFRKAAIQNHPDRGGSTQAMQDVNDAYMSLKKAKKPSKIDWEERRRKELQLALAVKNILLSAFNPDNFVNYFSELTNQKMYHEMLHSFPKDEKYSGVSTVGFKSEFFNKDRTIIFELDVFTFTSDIKSTGMLGYGSVSFPLTIKTYGFANNKRHKFGIREWKSTSDHSFLSDPKKIFPENKISKIISGKSRKGGKFSKRDMHTFLVNKLKSIQPFTEKGSYLIPLDNNKQYYLMLNRSVFSRIAGYSFFNIYEKQGSKYVLLERLPIMTWPESEETLKKFDKLIKEARKKKGIDQITRYVKSWINSEKANRSSKY